MKIHSLVDQITNSSGTTYIFSDEECEQNAYKVLRTVMDALGLKDESTEDYFDISFVNTERYNKIYNDYISYGNDPPNKRVIDSKISITCKNNSDLDIAPLMDGIFKCFNTYQKGMFFGGKEIDWSNDPNLRNVD